MLITTSDNKNRGLVYVGYVCEYLNAILSNLQWCCNYDYHLADMNKAVSKCMLHRVKAQYLCAVPHCSRRILQHTEPDVLHFEATIGLYFTHYKDGATGVVTYDYTLYCLNTCLIQRHSKGEGDAETL